MERVGPIIFASRQYANWPRKDYRTDPFRVLTDSAGFAVLGTRAVPKPRARGFASGLHHPLALALSLTRSFPHGRKEECIEKAVSVRRFVTKHGLALQQ
jgi:hypothetical protein